MLLGQTFIFYVNKNWRHTNKNCLANFRFTVFVNWDLPVFADYDLDITNIIFLKNSI